MCSVFRATPPLCCSAHATTLAFLLHGANHPLQLFSSAPNAYPFFCRSFHCTPPKSQRLKLLMRNSLTNQITLFSHPALPVKIPQITMITSARYCPLVRTSVSHYG